MNGKLRLRRAKPCSSRKFATCPLCSQLFITYTGSKRCVSCRKSNNAVLGTDRIDNECVNNQPCAEPPASRHSETRSSDTISSKHAGSELIFSILSTASAQGTNGDSVKGYQPALLSSGDDSVCRTRAEAQSKSICSKGTAFIESRKQVVQKIEPNTFTNQSSTIAASCEGEVKRILDDGESYLESDLPISPAMKKLRSPSTSSSSLFQAFRGPLLEDSSREGQHKISSLFLASSKGTDTTSIGASLSSSYRCFICNSDLSNLKTGLKGRMNHIKRCGKKHGVKPGEGTTSMFDGLPESSSKQAKNVAAEATETNVSNSWHEDATIQLALSQDQCGKSGEKSFQSYEKQSNLDSYFVRPTRSLNKVLMAGARNAAVTMRINAKADEVRQRGGVTAMGSMKGKGAGQWGRKRDPNRCPKYKRIPNTSIYVDAFHYASSALPQTHFLSHFHSDHYGGITKAWNNGKLYCSLPTAKLVESQLGVDKNYLHPLPMETPVVIDCYDKLVTVKLLDANHCPGAVMFLFNIGSKTVLHVGDMRWDRAVMISNSLLKELASGHASRIDELYLDTTYCEEKYASMPTQKEAISAAVKMAGAEIEDLSRNACPPLLLFGSYTIGKERIYLSVARELKSKVFVTPKKFKILSLALGFSPVKMRTLFTTDKSEAGIWIVPMGHCNFKTMMQYLDEANARSKGLCSRKFSRVVAFRPTGWTFAPTTKRKGLITTRNSGIMTIHGIPYSEHSSFSELVDCVRCLKPKKIIPTVNVMKSEEQVEFLLKAAHEKDNEERIQAIYKTEARK